MDVFDHYQTVTHARPYPHQIETYKALEAGQSVILRAPTGSGKSEAVFMPFMRFRGKTSPNRMIYRGPLRKRLCLYSEE